jgi:serralysin
MLLDIQALQYMYGANMTYNLGNDFYTFEQGADYYQTIWDAGGTDTIHYEATTDGALIDLRAGRFSRLGNTILLSDGETYQSDNVAIAYGVTVENAIGGEARDTIIGNSKNNVLDGRGGRDTLSGNGGNDSLEGGSGIDTLDGGSGDDVMEGGPGNDTYVRGSAGDLVTEAADAGIDRVKTAITYTLEPNVEKLTLTGTGAINGTGNTLDNTLTGNSGKNALMGAEGNDVLKGLAGADVLTGGTGSDRFDFDAVADSGIGSSRRDRIRDFNEAELDTIDLSTIDARASTVANEAFKFIGDAAFSDNATAQLRFDAANHLLLGSTDADSAAEFSIVVSGINSMTGGNFIL